LAHINYYYYSSPVGFLPIYIEETTPQITSHVDTFIIEEDNPLSSNNKIYYLQLKTIGLWILIIFIPLLLFSYFRALYFNSPTSKRRKGYKRKRKSSSPYKSFKF
jgi:hypothetical protein